MIIIQDMWKKRTKSDSRQIALVEDSCRIIATDTSAKTANEAQIMILMDGQQGISIKCVQGKMKNDQHSAPYSAQALIGRVLWHPKNGAYLSRHPYGVPS